MTYPRRILAAVVVLLITAGAIELTPPALAAIGRLRVARHYNSYLPPPSWRQKNYWGGSCYHASTITALRWISQHEQAAWWRQRHGHGEYTERLSRKLTAAGIPHIVHQRGDVRFLEECTAARLICAFPYYPSHAINFCGFTADDRYAVLLDNNRTSQPIYVEKATFVANWRNRYGGDAIAILGNPPAPEIRPAL